MSDKEYLEKNKDKRQKCEVWTRVMGYYRPTNFMNPGKQQEHKDRTFFKWR